MIFDHHKKINNQGAGSKKDFPEGRSDRRDRMKGNPFSPMEHRHTWERAIVQDVYPDKYTCDVYTERGKFLTGVPWPEGGDKAPKRGERYVVHFNLGKPVLTTGNIDTENPVEENRNHSISPSSDVGAESNFYANKGTGNTRGNRPKDVIPGDWVKTGSMGNMLGVLEGGTTVVKAGDLAQIIATQAHHLLRLVGKNVKLDTGAGTLDFKTEDGKSTINLYAGADEETESSPTAENFRIRCELGNEGELVDFRVTDRQGRSVYRVHVDPDGRVQKKSNRETNIVENDVREEIGDDEYKEVGGNKYTQVEGEHSERSGGSKTQETGGHHRVNSAQNTAINAMQDIIANAAKNIHMSSAGSVTDTDPSLNMNVSNGDMHIDIGNPVKGDAQVMMSGLDVNTFTGDMSFNSSLGSFEVNTNVPNSVKLGGPGPGVFSAILYEMFSAFMELFGTLIDTHVHPVPALAGVPTAPPIVPPWNSSRALFNASKSSFVSFGG